MLKMLPLALPCALALLLTLSAQASAQDAAKDLGGEGSSNEGVIAESTHVDADADAVDSDESDGGSNALIRQGKKASAEVFVDYNTFTSKREYFNTTAFGVRGYWFNTPDIKLGLSVAAEQFVYDTDLKYKNQSSPVAGFTFDDINRHGSAVRYAAESQFFVSDSVQASFSLFGANGKTEKKDSIKAETYTRSGLTFNLGNQWSWEKYTFRWDWLSLTYNFAFKVGSQNVASAYPSNKNGGMIVLSALAFGAEW
ncbi:MAG: hypothetical protein H7249_20190 [Chitinophagaceae bacterium]|nr:hypothetical protein [Oligoflexus sp.]